MAIVRQGALTSLTGTSSLGSATLSLSGLTLAENDILIVAFVIGDATDNRDISASGNNSGALTELADLYANDTNDTNLWVGYAKQGATVDTSVTMSVSAGSQDYVAHVLQYRGVDTTTPIDVTTTTATGTNGDAANPPSITPVTSGAKIVAVYAASQGTLTAWTAPSDVSNFVQTASTDKGRIATADKDWTSGAFDPAVLTGGTGNADDSWAAATLALRPGATGYTMAADSGTFTLTGTAVGLLRGYVMAASAASFTLTGTAAGLLRAYIMAADAAAFVLTGTDAALRRGYALIADAGSFVLTGTATGLLRGYVMAADAASFVLTGTEALLRRAFTMVAEAGAFVLSFTDILTNKDRAYLRGRRRRRKLIDYGMVIKNRVGR